MLLLDSSVCGLFKWRQFEPELILLAVGWYLRFSLSYRDVEELLAERGLHADHVTVWRWVQRYAPEMERRLRRQLKPTNDSWRVDETYIRVKGKWRYLYRWIPLGRPSTFSSLPSRTRSQQSASWPKRWDGRTIPCRASSTPTRTPLTRQPSYNSKPKALWRRIAGIDRCNISTMSWNRTTARSSDGSTRVSISDRFGVRVRFAAPLRSWYVWNRGLIHLVIRIRIPKLQHYRRAGRRRSFTTPASGPRGSTQ